MTAFEAAVYGVVQGFAWFVPISSDAHLEVASVFLSGHDVGAAVTAVIQWGTWVACVLYFWKDIARFARAFFLGIWENRPFATQDARLAWMLLVGTVPIGVLGILCKHYIETEWRRLGVVGAAEIGFALVLAAAEWAHRLRGRAGKPEKDLADVGWGEAMLIGFAQCAALVPGASRSGTTISAGIFAGMSRDAAARFSFLLSLPAVFAAGLYELYKEKDQLLRSQADVLSLVIATVVAGVVGYAAIWSLLRYLKTHSTWVFVGYRLVFGAALAAAVATGGLPNQPPKGPGNEEPTAKEQGGKKIAFFARTFSADGRLAIMGAETVCASSVFLKSPVTNDEESGMSSMEETRSFRQVQQETRGNRETVPNHPCRRVHPGGAPAGRLRSADPFPLDRRRSVMAVFTLRTLVLRGVAVIRDGQDVGLRLGAESPAKQTTEVRINPRQPSPNAGRGAMPAARPDDHAEYDRVAAVAATGAGRSLRSDGVLSRRGFARSASPAIPLGWCKPQGLSKSATAKRRPAKGVLAVEDATALASTWAS